MTVPAMPDIVRALCTAVAKSRNITLDDMFKRTRIATISHARWEVWWWLRKITGWSYPRIARIWGYDHTTVLWGVTSHDAMLKAADAALASPQETHALEAHP